MALNVAGLITVACFYAAILAVGLWAGWKNKKRKTVDSVLLTDRNMGLVVGIFTLTATWVGTVNSLTEGVVTRGLVWVQVSLGFCFSLVLGGAFFAGPMRRRGYVTMLDPFQQKYGPKIGALLFIPAVCGDILWTANLLGALGSTLAAILELDYIISISISTLVAVAYTLFGGLLSVAYTDIIELIFIVFGMVLCIPFAWNHPAVDRSQLAEFNWIGTVETQDIGVYIDQSLLVILGGIPWQVYFQRVLSIKSERSARILSYASAFTSCIVLIPPMLIGVIATATDWVGSTEYALNITTTEQKKMTLPLVLRYLTPEAVSFIGLGAVSAALMSSADSSLLSSSSLFAHNIYRRILKPRASEKHIVWVVWISVIVSGALSTVIAIHVRSAYALSYMSSDLIYVILFPQLLLVIHWEKYCNTYGCIASFFVGLTLRLLSGDPFLNLSPAIQYPFSEDGVQRFPFRTLVMLSSLTSHMIVSLLARSIFLSGKVPLKWDFLQCFRPSVSDPVPVPGQDQTVELKKLTKN